MLLVLQIFGHKPQYQANLNFEVMMAPLETLTRQIVQIYPLLTLNIRIKQSSPSNSCQGTSLKTNNESGTEGKARESPKSLTFFIWEPQTSVQNFVPINLVDFKLSHSNFDFLMVLDGKSGVHQNHQIFLYHKYLQNISWQSI